MRKVKTCVALVSAVLLGGGSALADDRTARAVIDDATVTTKVKAALIADPVTKAHQISVDTYAGTVKLSGFVDGAAAKRRAVELAEDVEGAVSVEDSLEVR